MIVAATAEQTLAITRALRTVASAGGTEALSAADRRGIASAGRYVFGHAVVGPDDVGALDPVTPDALATALTGSELRLDAVRCLAVVAFVDADPARYMREPRPGESSIDNADTRKLALVVDFARALGVDADFVEDVAAMSKQQVRSAALDMFRNNVASIPGMPFDAADPLRPFFPYRDAPDVALTERYEALHTLPPGTLGREFFEHYQRNEYAFPGEADALAARWATPHDTLHLLSGYSTSAQGELLVATFTGGMLRTNDYLASHVLPTILIYHAGIDINKGANAGDRERLAADPAWRDDFEGREHLGLDPEKLWVAWDRGEAMNTNLYSPSGWEFWPLVEAPLARLRERYGVPPLEDRFAALADDAIVVADYER